MNRVIKHVLHVGAFLLLSTSIVSHAWAASADYEEKPAAPAGAGCRPGTPQPTTTPPPVATSAPELLPLQQAAYDGNLEEVDRLLRRHQASINNQDEFGRTALHMALYAGTANSIKMLTKLIKYGADINMSTAIDLLTPLHIAVSRGKSEAVELLSSQPGINPNAADKNGNTPLHYAAELDCREKVKILLRHPAIKKDTLNPKGENASSWATLPHIKTLIENYPHATTPVKRKQVLDLLKYAEAWDDRQSLDSFSAEHKALIGRGIDSWILWNYLNLYPFDNKGLKILLKLGIYPGDNSPTLGDDKMFNNFLDEALKNNNHERIRLLVQYGANPLILLDKHHGSNLHQDIIIKYIAERLDCNDYNNLYNLNEILEYALKAKNEEIVAFILSCPKLTLDIEHHKPLTTAAHSGNIANVNALLDYYERTFDEWQHGKYLLEESNNPPLHTALRNFSPEHKDIARMLIYKIESLIKASKQSEFPYPDVEKLFVEGGLQPLRIAIRNGHPDLALKLIDVSHDLKSKPSGEESFTYPYNVYPLTLVIEQLNHVTNKNYVPWFKVIEKFIDVGWLDTSDNFLHVAAKYGACDLIHKIIQAYKDNGYDGYKNRLDAKGRTAIQVAAKHGRTDAITALLAHNVDTSDALVDALKSGHPKAAYRVHQRYDEMLPRVVTPGGLVSMPPIIITDPSLVTNPYKTVAKIMYYASKKAFSNARSTREHLTHTLRTRISHMRARVTRERITNGLKASALAVMENGAAGLRGSGTGDEFVGIGSGAAWPS